VKEFPEEKIETKGAIFDHVGVTMKRSEADQKKCIL